MASGPIRVAQALLGAQLGNGLVADGVWGPKTQGAFNAAPQALQDEINVILGRDGFSASSTLTTRAPLQMVPVEFIPEGARFRAPPELVSSPRRVGNDSVEVPEPVRVRLIERDDNVSLPVPPPQNSRPRQATVLPPAKVSNLVGVARQLADRARAAGITGVSLANLLANVAVETGFRLRSEGFQYVARDPRDYFRAIRNYSVAQVQSLMNKGRTAFFETVYGWDTAKGRELGNVSPGDGGKYYGRGLLQITGAEAYGLFNVAYPQYGVLINPDVLSTNMDAAIDSTIWFWKTNVVAKKLDKDIRRASARVGSAGIPLKVAQASYYNALV